MKNSHLSKGVLAFFFLIFSINTAQAQESPFKFELKTGIDANILHLKNDGVHDAHSKMSLNLSTGFGISYDITDKITIGVGGVFSGKGYTRRPSWQLFEDDKNHDPRVKVKVRAKYFDIPISISYSFIKKKSFRLFGTVKFIPSLLLGANTTFDFQNSFPVPDGFVPRYKNNISSSVVSYAAGVGASLRLAKGVTGQFELCPRIYGQKIDFKNFAGTSYAVSTMVSFIFDINVK